MKLIRIFGASKDEVYVNRGQIEAAMEPDVKVEENEEGEEVLVPERTNKAIRDEDGNPITKDSVFETSVFPAFRGGAELRIGSGDEEDVYVKGEYDSDAYSWSFTIRPHAETSDLRDHPKPHRFPEGWKVEVTPLPERQRASQSVGGFCVECRIPDEYGDVEVTQL